MSSWSLTFCQRRRCMPSSGCWKVGCAACTFSGSFLTRPCREGKFPTLSTWCVGNIPDSLASVIFKFVVKLLNFNSRYKSTFNQFGLVKVCVLSLFPPSLLLFGARVVVFPSQSPCLCVNIQILLDLITKSASFVIAGEGLIDFFSVSFPSMACPQICLSEGAES